MRSTPLVAWFITASLAGGLLYGALRTTTPAQPAGHLERKLLPIGREYVLARQGPPGSPVVIALHGAGETVDDFRALSGYRLEQLAHDHGFTLVYAVGVGRTFNDSRNPLPYKARKRNSDDVAYLRHIVADLDPRPDTAILGIGYSNGAHMLFRAATEDPGLFDGVAVSGAAIAEGSPSPTHAFSMVQLAGTRDRLAPVDGGSPPLLGRLIGRTLSVESTARTIAEVAQAELVEQSFVPGTCPIDVTHWAGPRHQVWLYLAHGAGHTFPVPNASRGRLYGRAPVLDFPQLALRQLGVIDPGGIPQHSQETGFGG